MTSPATLDIPHADATVLDNAAWHSLAGPHASFAIGGDLVRRYPADVAPFVAVRTWDDPDVWDALRDLVGPGAEVGLSQMHISRVLRCALAKLTEAAATAQRAA